MSNKFRAYIVLLANIAWLTFVGFIAIYGAVYGYTKNGIGGLFLGFIVGVFSGAMSATVWAILLYFLFRIGRFIFRLCKPSAGGD